MKAPLISVVMSVFNEPKEYLKESIESVLKQTLSDLEFIIVIDNPGYEEVHEIVKSYAAGDDRIKIISNQKNEGLASSLNRGFSIARGKYIARMDADDISFTNRLEKQFDFMEKNPDVSLIGSSILYIDENKNVLEPNFVRGNYKFLKRLIHYGGTPCFHPTWLFKKDLLKRIRGYRNLPTSQDYDFLMRMFYLNLKASNVEEPLLYHRMHFDRISSTKNIYQLKLTGYIMKAVRKGFILDADKFSQDAINDVLKTPKALYSLHQFSSHLLTLAHKFRGNGRRLSAFCLQIAGVLLSPYQLRRVFWIFKRSLVLNKMGKDLRLRK